MQVQLLLLRASASVFMNFSRILSCCVMDELDVLGFDRWKKLLWLALRSVENELNIFCTSQILSFTRAGILSYMPKCVYVADLIY